jgi:SAM-dependent methyltransferase
MDLVPSYDRVAEEYAARLAGELAHKPLDRDWLDRFAARLRGRGPVCDLGCGPGHVARYLHERGVAAFGLDLSPGMVAVARRLNPHLEFETGDLRALVAGDDAWAGIAAFYAIVHCDAGERAAAFAEMHRVLRPGGLVLLAFHVGREPVHRDELWGVPVRLDFLCFERETIEPELAAARLEVIESVEREPYPDVEHPSRRAYILARKPGR